ncbi:hypothetical protein GCM10023331_00870 [Algivirga pacifica]|uniref:Methyltransferase domain-containing protein n=2 Tax=Algivirga pacifica TaxID=1162670 RepID=A0ABP9CZP2_9BACT
MDHLPEQGEILILGGGTGWVLQELFRQKPQLSVTYVEASQKMLEISQQKLPVAYRQQVKFIHGTEQDVKGYFDGIITFYLLDVYTVEEQRVMMQRIALLAKKDTLWLVADFQLTGAKEHFWQNILLQTMFLFFRIVAAVNVQKLPDYEDLFSDHPFQRLGKKTFFGKMIFAAIYKAIK